MAAAPTVDVEIDHLDPAGDGVTRYRGRSVTVAFTIPGEQVRVRLDDVRGDRVTATLEAVLRASPHRVVPPCPHFGPQPSNGAPCGGCAWQHIAYPEQLRLKTALVTRLVRAAVPRAPAARPMIAGAPIDDPWGYRHKAHFVFGGGATAPRGRSRGRRSAALVMGHYARGSRRVIAVRECPVHDPRGNALAFRFRDAFARADIPAAPHASAGPALRSLAIRAAHGTAETMATLVLTGQADARLRAAMRRALAGPEAPSSCHVNLHPRGDAFIFGARTQRLTGPARMREQVAGVSFLISPTAFFQTNVQAAGDLVRLVLEAIPPRSHVLDLYAGAGLFALPLAAAGHSVVAVEENREAVEDGLASRALNRIPASRCQFVPRRVEDAIRRAGLDADAVVLDPPREGCSPPVIETVFGRLAPPLVLYISCNPEALARDLQRITSHGYTVEMIQPVDMFPHTPHVEAVVRLARR